jgi:RNA polymerase sigma-70 factor, ECF subfamily
LEGVEKAVSCDQIEKSDASLVMAAKSGDRAAFDALIARHQRKVLFAALRITRNREDAEDVVQQSFQNAFIHLPEFEGRSSFSTWLTRIVFNEALMLKRSNRRSREVSLDESSASEETKVVFEIADASPSPESRFSQSERTQLLFSAMSALKPGIRNAIEVCDLGEKSARETADALGLSVSAVKSRVNRGRRALRARLKRHMLPMTVTRHSPLRHAGRYAVRNPRHVRVNVSAAR